MSALMIVYARVDNVPQFEKYVAAVQPIIAAHGGVLVARAADPVVLEGDWPFATVGVLKFASVGAAEKFWHSPEYAAAKALRKGAADFQVVIAPTV